MEIYKSVGGDGHPEDSEELHEVVFAILDKDAMKCRPATLDEKLAFWRLENEMFGSGAKGPTPPTAASGERPKWLN